VAPKFAFVLAASVAFTTVAQIADASCGGNVCNASEATGKNVVEKGAKAVFINKGKSSARVLPPQGNVASTVQQKTRMLPQGNAPSTAQQTTRTPPRGNVPSTAQQKTRTPPQGNAPSTAQQTTRTPPQGNVASTAQQATRAPPRGNVASTAQQQTRRPPQDNVASAQQKTRTPPQCRKPCVASDTLAKRADCRKPCPPIAAEQTATRQAKAQLPTARAFRIPGASLEPTRWNDLDGWAHDAHADAFAAFRASCRPIVRDPSSADGRPVRYALQGVCARALGAGALDTGAAREFFEANFRPVRITKLGETAGFLTGYYEPVVDGSRFPTREFTVPLYRRPPDLVAAGATRAGGPFPNRGRAFRRTAAGDLVAYYDRGEIEDGALDGQHLEICWLRSASVALLIQIEGSARIRLEDGTILRVSYDAHNGYPFVPISRMLIDRKIISPEEMSLARIREWMQANPEAAKEVRRQNRAVSFFRVVGLTDDEETRGAQGIPLSVGRSIAVDSAVHAYGTPFFIEADLPLGGAPYRRTVIAQDTGSAIRGPARADIYFGAGEEAGQMAGRVRQAGRFTMLLPRDLTFEAPASGVPLPHPRPEIAIHPHPLRPMTASSENRRSRSVARTIASSENHRPRSVARMIASGENHRPRSVARLTSAEIKLRAPQHGLAR
jgi:membrane-bound lytic murein transglycosylase A